MPNIFCRVNVLSAHWPFPKGEQQNSMNSITEPDIAVSPSLLRTNENFLRCWEKEDNRKQSRKSQLAYIVLASCAARARHLDRCQRNIERKRESRCSPHCTDRSIDRPLVETNVLTACLTVHPIPDLKLGRLPGKARSRSRSVCRSKGPNIRSAVPLFFETLLYMYVVCTYNRPLTRTHLN